MSVPATINSPLVGESEPTDQVQRGRLTRSRRTDDDQELALLHRQVHASQGVNLHFAHLISLGYVLLTEPGLLLP